jgi:hypothetical protein
VQGQAADQDAGDHRGDGPAAAACQHPAKKRSACSESQLPAGGGVDLWRTVPSLMTMRIIYGPVV